MSASPRRRRSRDFGSSSHDSAEDAEDGLMMVAAEEGTGAGALGAVGGGKGGVESGDSAQIEIPFCGCLSVRYYQPYFDVDTSDVLTRLLAALFYCRREQTFMQMVEQKPDAYGPVWISTTLVFVAAVTSNISAWLSSWMQGQNWMYDFKELISISSVVYGFAFGVPLVVWFVLRQVDGKLPFIQALCLYGYALLVYIPAALLCVVPSEPVHWLALLGASAASAVFLLRNLAPLVVNHLRQHASIALGAIGLTQVIFTLILKLCFFYRN